MSDIGGYRGSYLMRLGFPAGPSASFTSEVWIFSCPPDVPQQFDVEPNQEHHFSVSGNIQTVEWGPTRKVYTVRFRFLSDDDKDDLMSFFAQDAGTWNSNCASHTLYAGDANPQAGGTNYKMKSFRIYWADGAYDDVRLNSNLRRRRVKGGRWEFEFEVISDES